MELPLVSATILKTGALFLLTLICFRLMGYRSLGDMEPLDYVIVLGIGEIMGSPLAAADKSILYPALAIVILTLLQISLSALYARVPKLGKVMEGGPVPVIKNGKIIERNLARYRIDNNSIMEELRIKGVRDENDVDLAYLEPSGRFSVILKKEASPVTPRYFGEKGSLTLVEKGEIRPEYWEDKEIDKKAILAFLAEENVRSWSEIETLLYKNGNYILERKNNQGKT
ncbi:MAG TPA: DUF421 domain-containing protein [Clostridiales bacterium]|nr:DUF421 domain-containing protein [Clostridiales bacterium]